VVITQANQITKVENRNNGTIGLNITLPLEAMADETTGKLSCAFFDYLFVVTE
jgi:hypothetical protein